MTLDERKPINHVYVEHHTYEGPGCAICGRAQHDLPLHKEPQEKWSAKK